MKRRIDSSNIIITGASSGIGWSLAEQLSGRGATLVLAARRLEKLQQLNDRLGGRHLCVQTDVSEPTQCQRLVEIAAGRLGRIDTLICNAGYGQIQTTGDCTPQQMRDIFATNVFGSSDLIHAALPLMRTQPLKEGYRGQIVIVSSAAAGRGLPYFGPYSATKAAQKSLAEALRVELSPQHIAVTSVHPVGTQTEFFDRAESGSSVKIQTGSRRAFRQSVELVAGKIIRAIERPRPEVWPFPLVKIGLAVSLLMPRLADRIMTRMRRDIEELNRLPI